jgi:hypothetical protein
MDQFDLPLLNALPALIALSVLVAVHPVTRRLKPWLGIGAAWLTTFVATFVVAVTHPNEWSLTCHQLLAPGQHFISSAQPCDAANSLPIWMTSLPSLLGIAVLLTWVLRSAHPFEAAMRTTGLLVAVVVAVLLLAQLSPNGALLAFLLAAIAIYAWPRFQRMATS